MAYSIFISHAGADNWEAYRVSKDIKEQGAKVFFDEVHIFAGDDFEDILLKNLKKSNELWVLLTPNALSRPYVWLEIGVAWSRGVRIIGLLLGVTRKDMLSADEIPMLLKRKRCVQCENELEYQKCLRNLKRRIRYARKLKKDKKGVYASV